MSSQKVNNQEIIEELKNKHPELKINDECIEGLINILKKQCPHIKQSVDESCCCTTNSCPVETTECPCDPCECDPCDCTTNSCPCDMSVCNEESCPINSCPCNPSTNKKEEPSQKIDKCACDPCKCDPCLCNDDVPKCCKKN